MGKKVWRMNKVTVKLKNGTVDTFECETGRMGVGPPGKHFFIEPNDEMRVYDVMDILQMVFVKADSPPSPQ
jgi:hypothetical protein